MAAKLELSRDGGKTWETVGEVTDMKWSMGLDFRPEELGSPETQPQCMTCYDTRKVACLNAEKYPPNWRRDCPDCCGEEG